MPAADYDICPYATFSLSNTTQPSVPVPVAVPVPALGGRSPAHEYSLQFQTFSQRDCYDAGPRRSLSRGAGHAALALAPPQDGFYGCGGGGGGGKRAGKRLVDSPPDGLNLGQ